MAELWRSGIGGILDYAAEDDVSEEGGPASRGEEHSTVVARTFDYADEEKCDAHMRIFLQSIAAAEQSEGQGFAAIKVLSLQSSMSFLMPYRQKVQGPARVSSMAAETATHVCTDCSGDQGCMDTSPSAGLRLFSRLLFVLLARSCSISGVTSSREAYTWLKGRILCS